MYGRVYADMRSVYAYIYLLQEYGQYIDWMNYQCYASQWCYHTDACASALRDISQEPGVGADRLVLGANSGHDDFLKGSVK
jgi:hypothetical protein